MSVNHPEKLLILAFYMQPQSIFCIQNIYRVNASLLKSLFGREEWGFRREGGAMGHMKKEAGWYLFHRLPVVHPACI